MANSLEIKKEKNGEIEARSLLQGFAASGGVVEGPARVITDINHLPSLEEGSILVFATSEPKIATVIEKLAGLVTCEGGRLGGASYYAREQGIPCVTAVNGSIDEISDGQMIRVDGFEGTVTLLS